MRILWLSQNQGLYGSLDNTKGTYNGGGWISSLQRLFVGEYNVEIALAFCTSQMMDSKVEGNFTYYPILHQQSRWQKIREYYGGYKHPDMDLYIAEMQELVALYKPDIIHIFGMENPLANVLGKINIPMVVHLQGLIIPYANAFWPAGISKRDFQLYPSKREWLLRNGFVYAYKSITARARRERVLFERLEYAMGRTIWDKSVTKLFAPSAKYFHVNEVLRPIFYEHQGEWERKPDSSFKIFSVISETMYKGLDLVMKTAQLLSSLGVQFEWDVIGIKPTDRIVHMFEKQLSIKSEEVNIHYLGIMKAERICEVALQSSLYVHPSYIDNSPNSLCEAQLLGLPVIATNVGGISTLLEGGNSIQLVPANGVCELANSIIEIQNNQQLASQIGIMGFMTASKRHNRDNIKNALIETYQIIISNYQGRLNG